MGLPLVRSSVGKKMIMAVTGLVLSAFVLMHLAGNLQVFLGQEAFNAYAKKLQQLLPLVWPIRIFLIFTLLVHVGVSAVLTVENRRARPAAYVYDDTVQASYASRSMWLSGAVVLFFILYHLLHFTFGRIHPEYFHLVDSKGRHDVYSMLVLGFQNPWISGAYLLAMGALGLHLSHAFSSFPQSLGWDLSRRQGTVKRLAAVAAALIAAGYTAIPAAVLCGRLKLPPGVL